jgi:AraC-like DNA-binding protein
MNTLHSSLYAVAITCCLCCSFVATGGARQPSRRFVYLGAYLALESLGFLFEWLMLHPTAPGKSLWLGSLMAMSFLLAPCLWLYAREITGSEGLTIRSLPPWHLGVVAAGMLLTLPLIQTAHLGPGYADPGDVAGKARSLFVHGTMLASAVLFLIQVPWYLRASVRILAGQVGRSGTLFSALPAGELNVLRLLILVLLTHWFVSLLRVLHCVVLGQDTGLGIVFASLQVAVTVWAFFSLLRPTEALGSQRLQRVDGLAVNEQDARPAAAEPKYARSSLNLAARTRIQRKLQEALRGRRLHCDNRLSLRGLCQEIRENPHYVSQVLNQDLATSFHDLVNRHRIEDAKLALVRFPGKTVLEICLETGFSSKSTFNTAFRRHTGMTPSEYRSRQLASS